MQASPKLKLRAFPSLGRNSPSPGEERGIWQGARLAAWHPELAASSRGWGRGVSRGTHCREDCWRGSRRTSEVQGHSERPEGTPGSLTLMAPGLPISGERGTPILYPGSCGAPSTVASVRGAWKAKAHPQSRGREGLGRWAAAAGPGRRPAPAVLPRRRRLGTLGGPSLPDSPYLSAHSRPGFSPRPPQPCPLAPLRDAFAGVRN